MKEAIYRLGEYKIIESDTGQLMWETHFGFGEFQKGHCFRKGSILFIGPAETCRNGFLKGEFLDDLRKYQQWVSTKFYGIGVDVQHCKNGKRLTKEEMMSWTIGGSHGDGIKTHPDAPQNFSNSAAAEKVTENAVYRLQRYEIIVRTDRQIISKTYSGSNTVSSGNCSIFENILFIGPQKNERFNLNKKQFLANLQKKPRWDQTDYFCKRFSLHECEPKSRIQGERKRLLRGGNATKKHAAENENKNNSKARLSDDAHQETFSSRLSAILGSLVTFTESLGKYGRFSHFRFIKSYFSKSIAIFCESGKKIMKRIARAVVLILLIIVSLFVLMIGYLKKQHEKWHENKNEHSLDHHEDH